MKERMIRCRYNYKNLKGEKKRREKNTEEKRQR
jgi:hypothetical protein